MIQNPPGNNSGIKKEDWLTLSKIERWAFHTLSHFKEKLDKANAIPITETPWRFFVFLVERRVKYVWAIAKMAVAYFIVLFFIPRGLSRDFKDKKIGSALFKIFFLEVFTLPISILAILGTLVFLVMLLASIFNRVAALF